VSFEEGRNGGATGHGGLLVPHAASSPQRVAEEMATASFSIAKFVALIAVVSGGDLLPSPDQHRALVPSSRFSFGVLHGR
jgi:hypothetical protein